MRNNAPQRVSTLRDLSAPAPAGPSRGGFGTGGPSSDDEEDAEQAEFFTGGEKSGLSVENPNAKRKGNPAGGASDSVKGILQKAKEYVPTSLFTCLGDNSMDTDELNCLQCWYSNGRCTHRSLYSRPVPIRLFRLSPHARIRRDSLDPHSRPHLRSLSPTDPRILLRWSRARGGAGG